MSLSESTQLLYSKLINLGTNLCATTTYLMSDLNQLKTDFIRTIGDGGIIQPIYIRKVN